MEFKGTPGPWQLKHSESKSAWNVVGSKLGGRYKIARLPYFIQPDLLEEWNEGEKFEQKANALLISDAPDFLKQLYNLAILSIQSDRYNEDVEFKIAVDKSFSLIKKHSKV